MSFYSEASLAYVASAGASKDGKAYSMKPVDGTGDFTFSRGSNLAATRVGADGLIEKGRENLLVQSNQFDTTWFLTDSIVLTSGQSGYDSANNAWKLENTLSAKYLYQSIAANGVQTFSFYAKSGTLDWVFILINSTNFPRVYFDLQNGLVGSELGSVIDSKIEAVSGATGWYRISITFNETISQVRIYPAIADNDITGAGSIYIQSAQLEIGLAATDYIESGATTGKAGLLEDEPRFDYSGGATCPSLLLEPPRTQLIPQTEYFGIWTNVSSNPVDVVDNFAISPEGVQNAAKLTFNGTNSWKASPSMNLTQQTYTGSVYMRVEDGGGNISGFLSIYATGTGAVRQDVPITITSEWQRFEAVFDNWTIGTGLTYFVIRSNTDGRSCLAYGAQFEEGSYPTSYIPNHSGGTITRAADGSLILSTAGTDGILNNYNTSVYIETKNIATDNTLKRLVSLYADNKAANPRVLLYAISTTIFLQYRVTGQSDVLISLSSVDLDAVNKFAIVLNDTNISLYHNGSLFQNTTIVKGLNFEEFYIAENRENGYSLNQVLIFPESLSQADAETLTT